MVSRKHAVCVLALVILGCSENAAEVQAPHAQFAKNQQKPKKKDSLYVMVGTDSLVIVDTSNPLRPVTISSVGGGNYHQAEVVVRGDYGYLYSNDGISVLDLSDPAKPSLTNEITLLRDHTSLDHLQLVGSYLVAHFNGEYSSSTSGLVYFDLSDPAHPSILAWVEFPPQPPCPPPCE